MPGRSNSFRDPTYDALDQDVEQRLKLPVGLLSSIRTKGERSNADQVSSAGARSVYQIIPATRSAVQSKYGVDAYAGPEQAALAAGYLLKESLQRNGGNTAAAAAEYHGGTDPRNHGPLTQAYVRRVAGSPTPTGQSTYDRVRVSRQQRDDGAPSLAKVYAAYRGGRMDPQQAAQFEHDVNVGAVLLPPGGSLKRTPTAPQLPTKVVTAYNDLNSGMTVEQRHQIDSDLQDGTVSLPRAAKLNPWRPNTTAENVTRAAGLGIRSALTGVGDVAGWVMNPVNTVLNATGLPQKLTGRPLAMANGEGVNVPDMLGLPKPQFESEKFNDAVQRGATTGLVTAGVGGAAATLPGAVGAVGRGLAAAPVADVVSGGVSGGSAEAARQAGYGPVGQFVAGLAGGGVGVAGGLAAERAVARIPGRRVAAELPASTPREVLIERNGALTDEGQELVARHGFTPDEIKQAYAGADTSTADGALPRGTRASEARSDPIAPTRPEPPANGARMSNPDTAVASEPMAAEASVPAVSVADPALVAPRTSSTSEGNAAVTSRSATDRTHGAAALGIPLTRGQALQDFATQDAEQTLRAQASGEGEKARAFLVDQADKIKTATVRFREGFGGADMTKAERGQVVKDALRDLRDQGKAGINTLYREAQAMGGDALALDRDGIVDAAKRVLVEADVPDGVKNVVRQEMARYGMLGKDAVTAEDGLTTVKLNDGRKVQFYGDPEPLTVGNAERFRQAISAQYSTDGPRKLSQAIKGAVDDAVETAVEAAARNGVDGPVGEKLRQARQAVVTQKETFSAKDVVQKLIDWKKGTRTDLLLPEHTVRDVLAGEVTNLKKMKAVLLSNPTPKTKAAWAAIQAEGVGTLFDKAYTANANFGGGSLGAVSGAKLNSEIIRFGIPKLKVLLDEPDFNRLMSLRRVVGEATIPITGTTNPSGSAFKLMRFLTPMAAKFSGIPLVGPAIDVASGLVKQAKATAEANRTLAGMTEYGSAAAARETASAGGAAARRTPPRGDDADMHADGFIRSLVEAARNGRLTPSVLSSVNPTRPVDDDR
ncbi:hypothetical protein NF700_06940 [Sphingomonadaceae bacterium OTU29MARTA1]|nr:hypothetical protein NF700_06940 [Sphingomonadaceae bacterium OTU29MARTA1]